MGNVFTARLIDGIAYQFTEKEQYLFEQIEDGFSVSNGVQEIDFFEHNFYKKFLVTHRETSYYESECITTIMAYEGLNSEKEQSYLVYTDYRGNYFDWLNALYNFKNGLAYQELFDFDSDKYSVDSKVSRKLLCDFKKFHDEAIKYNKQFGKDKWFIALYETMMAALKFSSNEGKLEFIFNT